MSLKQNQTGNQNKYEKEPMRIEVNQANRLSGAEIGRDQVGIGFAFAFASDWRRGWSEFSN